MFNKKRMLVFIVFILFMFLFITFAGGVTENQAIATRTVTFIDGFNDKELSKQEVIVGEDAEEPEVPKHEGYAFGGWYLFEDLKTRVKDFTNILEDLKVVGLYGRDLNNNGIIDTEEERLTVTFVDGLTNNTVSTQRVLPGMDANRPAIPNHYGYAFDRLDGNYKNVEQDERVVILFTKLATYKVTYNKSLVGVTGNLPVDNKDYLAGEVATLKTKGDLALVDAAFVGWSTKKPAGILQSKAEETAAGKLPATMVMPGNNVVLYALWGVDKNNNGTPDYNEEKYKVTYDKGLENVTGEVPVDNTEYLTNQNVTLKDKETLALEDAVFMGWSKTNPGKVLTNSVEAAEVVFETSPLKITNKNVKLYAVWAEDVNHNDIPDYEEERYFVIYDRGLDTVTGQYPEDNIEYLTTQEATVKDKGELALIDAVFIGWSKTNPGKVLTTEAEETGAGLIAVGSKIIIGTENVTLYAVWAEDKNHNNIPDYKDQKFNVKFYDDKDGMQIGETQEILIGMPATAPAVPTKAGYTFDKWDKDFSNVTTNLDVYPLWTPNTDTKYNVEHYQENIENAEYTLKDTDSKTGTTGEETNATAKTYEGFTVQAFEQKTIAADGSTVVKIYYKRNVNKVVYKITGTIDATENYKTEEHKYGATLELIAEPTKVGYTFSGWTGLPSTMPNSDVVVTGSFTPNTDTKYNVEHYQENIENAEYTLKDTDPKTGTTGEETNATANTYEGFTVQTITQKTIAADGSTVVKIYYKRNVNKVVYKITGTIDATENYKTEEHKYGATLELIAEPTKVGYTFSGWTELPATMPNSDVVVTGSFTPNTDTKYTVKHLKQNIAGTAYDIVALTEEKTGTTGELTNATANTYEGFTVQTITQKTIEADGSTIVEVKYNRNTYKVTYVLNNGSANDVVNYKYEASIATPPIPVKVGHTFTGWSDTIPATMPANDLTFTAQYTVNSYTATFKVNGTTCDTVSFNYGAAVVAPNCTSLVPVGYTLTGWNPTLGTMPANNQEYNAVLTANNNTAYKVEHYTQVVGLNGYELNSTENKTGTTDTNVEAVPKTIPGFEYNSAVAGSVLSGNVNGDGSLVLKVYYDRKTVTISFNSNGGTAVAAISGKYGTAVTEPANPTRTNYTFLGWSPAIPATFPTADTTLTAQWKANQIGLKVVPKPNVQFVFKKGNTYNIKDYMTVYEVYADGTEVVTTNYTTDFNTSTVTGTTPRTLTITQTKGTSTFTDASITYKVINEEAFQTKFEVISDPTATSYRRTKKAYCTYDCDSDKNTNVINTNEKFIEVIEHYDENISVEKVEVKYVGTNNFVTVGLLDNNYANGVIRWSRVTGQAKYDPVRAYIVSDTQTIDKVVVTYNRTGYGRYAITFEYTGANLLTAIDEVKL